MIVRSRSARCQLIRWTAADRAKVLKHVKQASALQHTKCIFEPSVEAAARAAAAEVLRQRSEVADAMAQALVEVRS